MVPFSLRDRAAALLRANLRSQLVAGEIADWSTLEVIGPVEWTDARGRVLFRYQAEVQVRSADGRTGGDLPS
jgi:hypothetical protein